MSFTYMNFVIAPIQNMYSYIKSELPLRICTLTYNCEIKAIFIAPTQFNTNRYISIIVDLSKNPLILKSNRDTLNAS
jgi:hypothetical protein